MFWWKLTSAGNLCSQFCWGAGREGLYGHTLAPLPLWWGVQTPCPRAYIPSAQDSPVSEVKSKQFASSLHKNQGSPFSATPKKRRAMHQ